MISKSLITNILIVVALAAAGYFAYSYFYPCSTCMTASGCSAAGCPVPASSEQE